MNRALSLYLPPGALSGQHEDNPPAKGNRQQEGPRRASKIREVCEEGLVALILASPPPAEIRTPTAGDRSRSSDPSTPAERRSSPTASRDLVPIIQGMPTSCRQAGARMIGSLSGRCGAPWERWGRTPDDRTSDGNGFTRYKFGHSVNRGQAAFTLGAVAPGPHGRPAQRPPRASGMPRGGVRPQH